MYWYLFSSFIYVYINFQPCLRNAACAGNEYGPCTTKSFCCRCDRLIKREVSNTGKLNDILLPKSARPLVTAVGVEGRMQLSEELVPTLYFDRHINKFCYL